MPMSDYYKGHGGKVMAAMKKTYKDEDTAKRVFYAVANKNKVAPRVKKKRKKG